MKKPVNQMSDLELAKEIESFIQYEYYEILNELTREEMKKAVEIMRGWTKQELEQYIKENINI